MTTRVVNIRRDKYDVYAGRNHKGEVPQNVDAEGWLGNPHGLFRKKGDICLVCATKAHRPEECLNIFKWYFYRRVEVDAEFRSAVLALRGKILGCFCLKADGSGECHAKIIAEWIDAQKEDER